MSVARNQFMLYPYARPALRPGRYGVRAEQQVAATTGDQLVAKPADWTLQVAAPRLRMPPEELLGCFPAPSARDANIQQLPHVALKSRTLPWARVMKGDTDLDTKPAAPWMAVLLFEKSEVNVVTNKTLGDFCGLTASTTDAAAAASIEAQFPGLKDELSTIAPANLKKEPLAWVEVPKSIAKMVMPDRATELPLLTHVREVNTADAEGKGDDDGFVAIVLGNRLPEKPDTDWVACLVNLEGFDAAHDVWKRPAGTVGGIKFPGLDAVVRLDQLVKAAGATAGAEVAASFEVPAAAVMKAGTGRSLTARDKLPAVKVIGRSELLLAPDALIDWKQLPGYLFEARYKLPLLHHWEFHSAAEAVDFETLIRRIGTRKAEGKDRVGVGLLGDDVKDLPTGHLGLRHITRGGVVGTSTYRGPAVPVELAVQTTAKAAPAGFPVDPKALVFAEQLYRHVTLAGKPAEDVGLAVAFELGRLIALSRKDVLQLLVDWQRLARQERINSLLDKAFKPFVAHGIPDMFDLPRSILKVRDLVDGGPIQEQLIDVLGIERFATVANHMVDASAALSGLSTKTITTRMATQPVESVTAALEGRSTEVGGLIPDAGLGKGGFDLGSITGTNIADLDAAFPDLMDVLFTDFTRGGA